MSPESYPGPLQKVEHFVVCHAGHVWKPVPKHTLCLCFLYSYICTLTRTIQEPERKWIEIRSVKKKKKLTNPSTWWSKVEEVDSMWHGNFNLHWSEYFLYMTIENLSSYAIPGGMAWMRWWKNETGLFIKCSINVISKLWILRRKEKRKAEREGGREGGSEPASKWARDLPSCNW